MISEKLLGERARSDNNLAIPTHPGMGSRTTSAPGGLQELEAAWKPAPKVEHASLGRNEGLSAPADTKRSRPRSSKVRYYW